MSHLFFFLLPNWEKSNQMIKIIISSFYERSCLYNAFDKIYSSHWDLLKSSIKMCNLHRWGLFFCFIYPIALLQIYRFCSFILSLRQASWRWGLCFVHCCRIRQYLALNRNSINTCSMNEYKNVLKLCFKGFPFLRMNPREIRSCIEI